MSLAGYEYDYGTSAEALAALLHIKRDDLRKQRLALVLPQHLYFDDSGTHDDSEAVAFGGWLSTFDRWIELENSWNRALKEEGITIFHSTDLDAREGEFVGWTKDRADPFMARLTAIAAGFAECGIGCGIVRADYERLFPDWLQTDFKDPLNFCVYGTLSMMIRQNQLGKLVIAESSRPLRAMVEHKRGYEGFVETIYYRFQQRIAPELLGHLSWGDKKDVPLQAADLIAREISKYVANLRYRPQLPVRRALEALGTKCPLFVTTPDEERIEGFRKFVEQVRDGTIKPREIQ